MWALVASRLVFPAFLPTYLLLEIRDIICLQPNTLIEALSVKAGLLGENALPLSTDVQVQYHLEYCQTKLDKTMWKATL